MSCVNSQNRCPRKFANEASCPIHNSVDLIDLKAYHNLIDLPQPYLKISFLLLGHLLIRIMRKQRRTERFAGKESSLEKEDFREKVNLQKLLQSAVTGDLQV